MILPFEQTPVHLIDGKPLAKKDCHSYIMYPIRWTPGDVESYTRDRKLPDACSLARLNRYQTVMPITMIPHSQRLNIRKFSAISQSFQQIIIMTEQIDDVNTTLSVIPSEHFAPPRTSFKALVEASYRLRGQTREVGGGHLIDLDETLGEHSMHYRSPLTDIPALLLKFFSSNNSDAIFREGVPAIDRASYVCQYRVMMQRQLNNVLKVADQFKSGLRDEDGNDAEEEDEEEWDV